MLATKSLQLSIGDRLLIDALDWVVEPGQCWCVIGRNGTGKSTLLRTLAGLHNRFQGRIEIQKKSLEDWPLAALARQRAFLPQTCSDAFSYRVMDVVLTARHPHSDRYWESADDYQIAQQALHRLGLGHLIERDVRTLSGGERQRVAIAALLAQDTPLLLLDEPTNALDGAHQLQVMQHLAQICKEQKKAVIMVVHDLNVAQRIASHVLLLMGDGRWHCGALQEVMQPALLSACLGHEIEAVLHQGRTIFTY